MALVIIGPDGSREPLSSFGRGLPLGTSLTDDNGTPFVLTASSATIDNIGVVPVADYPNGFRWIASPHRPDDANSAVALQNSTPTQVSDAVEELFVMTTKTPGAETTAKLWRFLLGGVRAFGAMLTPFGILLPGGPPGVGVEFDPGAGGRTLIGYDVIGPYLWAAVDGLTHFYRLYQNLLMLDYTQSAGGVALDTGQATGIYTSGSGASTTVRNGTIDGLECLISGGIVWGRLVNSAASIAAAKCVTVNSAGLGIIADATTPTTCLGVSVSGSAANANLRYVRRGLAAGVLTSATPGTRYYLGAAGALTTTRNTTSTQAQIQVGIAVSATDLEVEISDRGIN